MQLLNGNNLNLQDYMTFSGEFDRVREKSDLIDQLTARVNARKNGFDGDKMPWESTHNRFKLRKSELTIWAGVNGQGKSLILGQIVLSLLQQKKKALIVSLEMPAESTLDRMVCQFTGKKYPDAEDIKSFMQWRMDHLYIFDYVGTINRAKVIALCRYASDIGCDHIVIDSLTKCTGSDDDLSEQKAMANELAEVAKEVKIGVHLVHHARKGNDETRVINKFDIKGSGAITDLADNVMLIARNLEKEKNTASTGARDNTIPDQFLIVSKQRHGDWEGVIPLWFDFSTYTYTEFFGQVPTRYLDIDRTVRNYIDPEGAY